METAVATSLHYLTVQDVLWINLQVAGRPNTFNYAKLEEATFYQYAYGDSDSIEAQAARLASGFGKMSPLKEANQATGFVALVAFLHLNGKDLGVTDALASSWYRAIYKGEVPAKDALAGLVETNAHHHVVLQPDVRAAIKSVIEAYPETLKALGKD